VAKPNWCQVYNSLILKGQQHQGLKQLPLDKEDAMLVATQLRKEICPYTYGPFAYTSTLKVPPPAIVAPTPPQPLLIQIATVNPLDTARSLGIGVGDKFFDVPGRPVESVQPNGPPGPARHVGHLPTVGVHAWSIPFHPTESIGGRWWEGRSTGNGECELFLRTFLSRHLQGRVQTLDPFGAIYFPEVTCFRAGPKQDYVGLPRDQTFATRVVLGGTCQPVQCIHTPRAVIVARQLAGIIRVALQQGLTCVTTQPLRDMRVDEIQTMLQVLQDEWGYGLPFRLVLCVENLQPADVKRLQNSWPSYHVLPPLTVPSQPAPQDPESVESPAPLVRDTNGA